EAPPAGLPLDEAEQIRGPAELPGHETDRLIGQGAFDIRQLLTDLDRRHGAVRIEDPGSFSCLGPLQILEEALGRQLHEFAGRDLPRDDLPRVVDALFDRVSVDWPLS